MSDTEKTYFVGSKKVAQIHVSEGTNLVSALYENEQSEDFTAEQWEGVRSEEAYDDGLVVIRKYEGLMKRIIRELRDARVTIQGKTWILEQVDVSLNENYKKALAKVFGVPDTANIMLAQIDETLKAA